MKKLSLLLAGIVLTSLLVIALKETSKTPIFNERTADSSDAQLFYNEGLKEEGQENWSAALTYFQKATVKNPDNADAWSEVGYCYSSLGRHQDAIEAYKQAIRIKPDLAGAHYNLGLVYLLIIGDKGSALEEYKILKTLDAELANKLFNLIYK